MGVIPEVVEAPALPQKPTDLPDLGFLDPLLRASAAASFKGSLQGSRTESIESFRKKRAGTEVIVIPRCVHGQKNDKEDPPPRIPIHN